MRRTARGRFRTAGDRLDAERNGKVVAGGTGHAPGSDGKIAELARRADAGEELFHGEDYVEAGAGVERLVLVMRKGARPPGDQNATVGSARAGDVLGEADEETARRLAVGELSEEDFVARKKHVFAHSKPPLTPLARSLRALLAARDNMSRGALSLESGVSKAYLSHLWNGRKTRPGLSVLLSLAKALRVGLDELCGVKQGA
jgi:DNA-binding Xre family transcriptional regulator